MQLFQQVLEGIFENWSIRRCSPKYLNAGKGEAWAGQVRAMPDNEEKSRVADFKTEENFGAAVPIGSMREIIARFNVTFPT